MIMTLIEDNAVLNYDRGNVDTQTWTTFESAFQEWVVLKDTEQFFCSNPIEVHEDVIKKGLISKLNLEIVHEIFPTKIRRITPGQ